MNKIIIYSLDGCLYSQHAINTLKYNNIDYQIIHIDKDDKEYYKFTYNGIIINICIIIILL